MQYSTRNANDDTEVVSLQLAKTNVCPGFPGSYDSWSHDSVML